jgi:hypothetical protein
MSTTTRSTILASGAALLMLTLSACGGGSSSAGSTSPSAAASAGAAGPGTGGRPDFTAYRDCMAQNGVTLPDFGGAGAPGSPPSGIPTTPPSGLPSGGPGAGGPGAFPLPSGVDQATFDKAQTACASLRPQFGAGGGGRQIDATALAAFKSCLGDHDVTVSDAQDWMRQLDRTDPKVSAALKTCAPLLPAPGSGTAAASPAAS